MKRLTLHYCFMLLLLQLSSSGVDAAPRGEILSEEIASSADTSVLMAEANLFNTIRQGITLTIAYCEGLDSCVPDANRVEVERIIDTLDTRISSLVQRHEETGEAELETILIAYADARDGYTEFIEKLGAMPTGEDDIGLGDDFGDDIFGEAAGIDEQYNIFRDFDEELFDEEDELTDFEDEQELELEQEQEQEQELE